MTRSKVSLVIILASGFILRFAALNDPITYDEAYTYIAFASRGFWTAISDYSLPNNHIFHTVLVFLSTQLLGNSLWAIRLPAFLAGMGMIWAAYALGKTAYSEETGLAGAALVAYLPAIIRYSTDARGYSMVGLLTLIVFLLATRLANQPSTRDWIFLTVTTALGLWAIPLMLYPAGAVYLWLALTSLAVPSLRQQGFIRNWFLSGLGAGCLTLALYTPALIVSGWRRILANGFVQPLPAKGYFTDLLPERLGITWQVWSGDVPAALIIVLTIGFILSLALHWRIQTTRIPLSLTMLLWVGLYVVLRRPDAFDRFWSWMLAPMLVWAAAGLIETASKLRGGLIRGEQILGIASLIIMLIAAGATLPSISTRWSKVSNAQAASEALATALRPGDLVLVGYPNNTPVWYYLLRAGVAESYWQPHGFSQAYLLLAANQPKQTLASLISDAKMDPADFDLSNAKQIGRFGQILIYQCLPKGDR